MGLELAGIELNDRGYIKVNERLETTAPGVWAIGEVAGSPQFTHVSVDDFRVVRDNLAGGNHIRARQAKSPTPFSQIPELARIGLTENEADAHRIDYRLFKIPMEHVLRAQTLSEARGFLKALVGVTMILFWLHRVCCRCRRDHGLGTDCHYRPASVYRTPRGNLGPPNACGGTESLVLVYAIAAEGS